MARTTYKDIVVVHRYLDEIVTFIQGIVHKESSAIVIACQVFEEHQKSATLLPFRSETDREQWLRLKARDLATTYLKHERDEAQKVKAIRAAIHDYPQAGF
jgi:hypothetical protein